MLVTYATTNGPEIDGLGALVGNDRTTCGMDACDDRKNCQCVEEHLEVKCQLEMVSEVRDAHLLETKP